MRYLVDLSGTTTSLIGSNFSTLSCVSVFTEIYSSQNIVIFAQCVFARSKLSYVSGDSAPYTDELFIDIPENRDLREFSRHVLVNFNFVLWKSQFRSNILLKSGQDFAFSQTTKI